MAFDRTIARRAVLDSLPVYVPAIPFTLVIGLAIIESGMNPVVGWFSSPIIFGGAAQLTLITLLGAGTSVFASIAAALVVNARHLMYSAAMAPIYQRQPRWFRWVGPYFLIDQLFALSMLRANDDPKDFRTYYLAGAATFWTLWLSSNAVALLLGPVVPAEWNLTFAVPILFLGLLVIGMDKWPKAAAALTAAGVTFLTAGLPNRSGLLVGALAGIAVGFTLERVRR